jgi:FHS family L-fucose permease-like MFS transporter
MTPNTNSTPAATSAGQNQTYRGPFAVMTTLFFMWGFMTVFNDILIPRFKEAFGLNYFEAMLVQFAFFGAYFIGSLIYFLISAKKGDPIARIGYKNGVIIGLILSALGSALFYPAAKLAPYSVAVFRSSGGTNLTQVGSPMLAAADIKDQSSLATKLTVHADPLSQLVWNQFSDETRSNLLAYTIATTNAKRVQLMLAEQLNEKIIRTDCLFTNQSTLAGVSLSEQSKTLAGQKLEGHPLFHFNRLVLEEAYPNEVTKAPSLVGGHVAFVANSYPLFLLALFVVGLGFAILQIAANPYVTILGSEKTASSRLNLAQGFNSIGTTIGPLIGGFLIFQYFAKTGAHGAESVKMPYMAFCVIFLVLAVIFYFINLPHVGEGHVEPGAGALKYPHVVLGVIAIFMYVGGEVSVGSAIINFLGQKSVADLTADEASKYVAIYWGGLMIGRFMGAVELSEMRKANKQTFLIVIPLLAWLLLWVAKSAPLDAMRSGANGSVLALWRGAFVANWSVFKIYLPFVGLCWLLFQFGKARAGRTLVIFSLTVVALLLTAILVGGQTAMWCVVAVGLFTSIGWSNTFSLALEGTGIYKSQVSSLLVMAILGGAILPPTMGYIADKLIAHGTTHGLQVAFIVPLIAYAYVAFYGAIGHKIGRKEVAG